MYILKCIGTVFREKEDAHLVAALNFSLQWLKKSSAAEDSLVYEASVELLQRPDDHYELVEKGSTRTFTF
jgi:hypothetical protein